jgi:hypothetical protein
MHCVPEAQTLSEGGEHKCPGHAVVDTPPPLSAVGRDDEHEHSNYLVFRNSTRQLWASNKTTARLTG